MMRWGVDRDARGPHPLDARLRGDAVNSLTTALSATEADPPSEAGSWSRRYAARLRRVV